MKSAFSSTEVALPLAAEQGFTGLLGNSLSARGETPAITPSLEEFARDELLKVDSEGRCVVTDHGHFGELSVLLISKREDKKTCFSKILFNSL